MKKAEVLLWIMRICNRMNLSNKVSEMATLLFLRNEHLLKNYKPKTIAGGLVHIASVLCKERRTQGEISAFTGVSEVSIRKICKVLKF